MPVFKYTSNDKDRALEHIRSFPHVPSHYTRKNSQRQYLEHGLNITKMYELYQVNVWWDGAPLAPKVPVSDRWSL